MNKNVFLNIQERIKNNRNILIAALFFLIYLFTFFVLPSLSLCLYYTKMCCAIMDENGAALTLKLSLIIEGTTEKVELFTVTMPSICSKKTFV
jgi:hypothetical protein